MDFTPLIIWWLLLLIFGLVGWPIAFSLLPHLPDRGFAFIRPLGFLLSGYILWLGGTFRLLQNGIGGILVSMLAVLAIGLIWHRQQVKQGQSPTIMAWLKREWRYVISVELLFVTAFVGWAIFKAFNPNIETAGGEKWMEIAFINGILRSDHFPPQDPWLSGFGISYYYFGYVLMAKITQLAGLVSTIAFNLYVPSLFAMTLTAAFGIVANMVSLHRAAGADSAEDAPLLEAQAVLTGLLAGLFVAIMGNLIGLLEVLHKRGLFPADFWVWLDVRDLKIPPAGPGDSWIPDRFIWWWRGSRVLTDYNLAGREQEVIDEFPFFSFLLGDVHPHVLTIPFVLLATALALHLLVKPVSPVSTKQTSSTKFANRLLDMLETSWRELLAATGGRLGFLLYAICIGGLSFLNTWDFPIYLGVVGLAFIVRLTRTRAHWPAALAPGLVGIIMLAAAGILLYVPFYATFQSQAQGILPNLWNPTRLPHLFIFFGPFLVAVTVLLYVLSTKDQGWKKELGWSMALALLGPVLAMIIILSGILLSPAGREFFQGILANPEIQAVIGAASLEGLLQESLLRRLTSPWAFLLLGGLFGWTLAQTVGLSESGQSANRSNGEPKPRLIERFVLIMLLVGLGLPLVVEFIFLRDNFGTRMNTIFKFYFQAWILLALASAFSVYYVSRNLRGVPLVAWRAAMILLVGAAMIYPILATANKANYFKDEPTLNGIAWISRQRPGDYAAIEWLRVNAVDGSVIVEAPGSNYAAYQYTGRVSAMTGLPTLLGWGGHQSQWRGNYDEPRRREPEIDLLFNSLDPLQTRELLDKYDVKYVYVGPLERERYSPQGLSKFDQLLNVAFQHNDVTIYVAQ